MKNYSVPELHLKVLKPVNPSRVFKQFACLLSFSLSIFFSSNSVLALEDQETYSIFLVKTATPKELTYEVDNKRVHALTYIVQKGDSLWKILRKKGLLRQDNLSELLSVLKKLNRSLRNLDLIYPGEKIIIPLKITSLPPDSDRQKPSPRIKPPIITSKDLKYENYKVKPGDSIARVARRLYNIPPEDLYNEYLELVKKINPTLEDLNGIYAGQVIKLPIYSPEIARKPIEPAFSSKAGGISEKTRLSKKANSLANDLGKILVEMGEEWIPSGDHFVPFESGGFISLKATSFPILHLQNGLTIIVDITNNLPKNIESLIEACWTNYRVVHLMGKDDLRSALTKILNVCDYPKIYKKGEPLELRGDITLRVTGDWILSLSETRSDSRPNFAVINLVDTHTPRTSWLIRRYLERAGVKIIDYPPQDDDSNRIEESEILRAGTDCFSLIEKLLLLTGHHFSTQMEIPVYQSSEADLMVSIKTDFFLRIKESDAIIDLTGLAPQIVSLLEEHQFSYLSLSAEKDPLEIIGKTLEFLDIQFRPGLHSFLVAEKDNSRSIELTIPGIIFEDPIGQSIVATPANLQGELAAFLSQKGFRILVLSSLSQEENSEGTVSPEPMFN